MPATATPASLTATATVASPRPPGPRFGPARGPSSRGPSGRSGGPPRRGKRPGADSKAPAAEHEILFQKFFKSVGPRTYAAQVKRANNGNHYLVLTEGKRDEASDEVRKTRLFVYSEDFVEFFRLIKSAAEFVKANPLPADVRQKREKFWQKQPAGSGAGPARASLGSTPQTAAPTSPRVPAATTAEATTPTTTGQDRAMKAAAPNLRRT
jgi:hypothetical protein